MFTLKMILNSLRYCGCSTFLQLNQLSVLTIYNWYLLVLMYCGNMTQNHQTMHPFPTFPRSDVLNILSTQLLQHFIIASTFSTMLSSTGNSCSEIILASHMIIVRVEIVESRRKIVGKHWSCVVRMIGITWNLRVVEPGICLWISFGFWISFCLRWSSSSDSNSFGFISRVSSFYNRSEGW